MRESIHMLFGFALGALLCITFYYSLHFNEEILQALVVFNLFFVLALFPLNGSLQRKVVAMIFGNGTCFLWNTIFYQFACCAAEQTNGTFSIVYLILGPILNLFWVVSFWSLSLTFLLNSRNRGAAKIAD